MHACFLLLSEGLRAIGPLMKIAGQSGHLRGPAWLAILLLMLTTGLVYVRVAHFDFVAWDDDRMLTQNPHVQSLSLENLRWMFFDASYNRLYLPLGWLAYALSYLLFGINPGAHHLLNLVLHIGNAILVFFILRTLLALNGSRQKTADARFELPVAFIGTLFWAVHPLRVEVVAWIGARVHEFAALFVFTALLCYLKVARNQQALIWRAPLYWVTVAFYLISLLNYPAGIMFPFALIVLDMYVLNRRRQANDWKELARFTLEKAPFFLILVAPAIVSIWGRYHSRLMFVQHRLTASELFSHSMQASYVWIHYIWILVWPFHLSPMYSRLTDFDPLEPVFVTSACLVIVITCILFLVRRKCPALWAVWLCHLLLLVPFLGITQHPHFASDRYTYIQGLIWSALLAGGVCRLLNFAATSRVRRIIIASFAIPLLCLAVLAYQQTAAWSDSITLFQYMINEGATTSLPHSPQRETIYARLGIAYLDHRRSADALDACNIALQIEPDDSLALLCKATACMRLASDKSRVSSSDQVNPFYSQAAEAADRACRNGADSTGFILAGYAYAYMFRFTEAEDRLHQAIALFPNDSRAHLALGEMLWRENKFEPAVRELDLVISLVPTLSTQRDAILRQWDSRSAGFAPDMSIQGSP